MGIKLASMLIYIPEIVYHLFAEYLSTNTESISLITKQNLEKLNKYGNDVNKAFMDI